MCWSETRTQVIFSRQIGNVHTHARTTEMKLVVEQVNVDVCARARARISRGCDNACVRYVRDSVRVCACGGRRVQLRRPAERDVFART